MIIEVEIDDERHLAAAVADHGLDLPALGLLIHLLHFEQGAGASYRLLAHRFKCGRKRIRTIVKRLIALGYVSRSPGVLHVRARPNNG